MFNRLWLTVVAISIFAASAAITGGEDTAPIPKQPIIFFATGDMMDCSAPERSEAVAKLMESSLDSTVGSFGLTLGDNSQNRGSKEDYDCLDRSTWAKLRSRIYPNVGNHDYQEFVETGTVPQFYLWFLNTGRWKLEDGYYAIDKGGWYFLSINSELMRRAANSSQYSSRAINQLTWLEQQLHDNYKNKCIVAYLHRPMFSSGKFASPAYVGPIFNLFYQYGVDLVLTGHEHFLAWYPPLNMKGEADRSNGVPMLTVGTGGGTFKDFPEPKTKKYGETVVANILGIVRVELAPGKFDWRFVSTDPNRPDIMGSGYCHDNPAGFKG